MANTDSLGYWVRRFLLEHLVAERNLSLNTQASYRDMLVLLLPFVADTASVSIDKLSVTHITQDSLRSFLRNLETIRRCSVATRNQRLAAVHALARFISRNSPEHTSWCTEVCAVPFKKAAKPTMCYLEKAEMDALLDAPDRSSVQGTGDYALLIFLYNTGARADELAHAKVGQLQLGRNPAVRIIGKGNKWRLCPLWSLTSNVLEPLISGRHFDEPVFLNCRKQPLTRFGIRAAVVRYAKKAASRVPSIANKRVSAHTIRHTTAVHLLRAGVDINTIRAWLGHVSLETTNVYAEVDLELKARALAHCEIFAEAQTDADWRENPELMSFLKSL